MNILKTLTRKILIKLIKQKFEIIVIENKKQNGEKKNKSATNFRPSIKKCIYTFFQHFFIIFIDHIQ